MTDICVLLCSYHLKVNRLLCTEPHHVALELNETSPISEVVYDISLYFFLTSLFDFSIDLLPSLLLSSFFDLRTLPPPSITLLFQPSFVACDEQEKGLLTLFPTCVSVLLNPVSNLFVLRRGHWIYHRRCISKSSSNSGNLG